MEKRLHLMNFLPWNIYQFWKHNKMNSLVQEKFEVVLSAGNGGNGAIKPFSTLNWGIFSLQQLGHTIMQNLIFPSCDQSERRYAWVLFETKFWDQYWRYLCFQGAFLHFTKFQPYCSKIPTFDTSYEAAVKFLCLSCLLKLFSQNFSVSDGP